MVITSPSWVFTCLYVFSHKLWHLSNPTLLFQEFIVQNYFTVYVQEMKVTTLMYIYVNLFSYFHQKIIFSNCQISKHCNYRSYLSPWKPFSSFHKISLCVCTCVCIFSFLAQYLGYIHLTLALSFLSSLELSLWFRSLFMIHFFQTPLLIAFSSEFPLKLFSIMLTNQPALAN